MFEESSIKKDKIDQAYIPRLISLINMSNYEEFVAYFRNTTFLIECDFMRIQFGYKLAPSENAVFQQDGQIFIGKVVEMVKINLLNQQLGFIKLRLYYDKLDVEQIDPKIKECTNRDLFLTEQTQWFNLTDAKEKIEVYPIEKFDQGVVVLDQYSYYTRSEFNIARKQFKVPVSEWTTYCYCNRLFNPEDGFLQCDRCKGWVHYECSHLSDKELEKIMSIKYLCPKCKEKNGGRQQSQNSKLQTQETEQTRKSDKKSSKKGRK